MNDAIQGDTQRLMKVEKKAERAFYWQRFRLRMQLWFWGLAIAALFYELLGPKNMLLMCGILCGMVLCLDVAARIWLLNRNKKKIT